MQTELSKTVKVKVFVRKRSVSKQRSLKQPPYCSQSFALMLPTLNLSYQLKNRSEFNEIGCNL